MNLHRQLLAHTAAAVNIRGAAAVLRDIAWRTQVQSPETTAAAIHEVAAALELLASFCELEGTIQ